MRGRKGPRKGGMKKKRTGTEKVGYRRGAKIRKRNKKMPFLFKF